MDFYSYNMLYQWYELNTLPESKSLVSSPPSLHLCTSTWTLRDKSSIEHTPFLDPYLPRVMREGE